MSGHTLTSPSHPTKRLTIDQSIVLGNTLKVIIAITASLLLIPMGLYGQKEKVRNRPYADHKHFKWGYQVGLTLPDLVINNHGEAIKATHPDRSILYASMPSYAPGFSVGVMGSYSPSLALDLRLAPTLHFGELSLTYLHDNRTTETVNVKSNYLELPLMVKYNAIRFNNHRPYITLGSSAKIYLGQKNTDLLNFRPINFSLSIGVGCDIYLRYFKLSPELRLCYGIGNNLQKNRREISEDQRIYYTDALKSSWPQTLFLTFYFE